MATKTAKQISLPSWVDLKNAERWSYSPDLNTLSQRAEEFRKQNSIKPAASDKSKAHLLIIDAQNDFCFPPDTKGKGQGGTLYVGGRSLTGAIEDNKRLANFIYTNADKLTEITPTMDTHFPFQIFYSSFWQDDHGAPLAPFTTITHDMVKTGKAKPHPSLPYILSEAAGHPVSYEWILDFVAHYTKSLEDESKGKGKSNTGKYNLFLWPFHCMVGSVGHALVGLIFEAVTVHSLARFTPGLKEIKGGNFLTENYSVLSPEVLLDHKNMPIAQRNVKFIEKLLRNKVVIIAGQAASHCVKSSIDDLLNAILHQSQDPTLAKRVYIMTDTTSAVTVPDGKGGFFVDNTKDAEDAFQKFADAGMNLVKSTDTDWLDKVLA